MIVGAMTDGGYEAGDFTPAFLLQNEIRPYAWGSPTAIPDLLGIEPTGEPRAELWMGAHPSAPSRLSLPHRNGGELPTLLSRVDADPKRELGEAVLKEFGPRLPFLLKVLAADQPLSLQAHPSAERAVEGFAEEDERGIPLDAPNRNYRDTSHKPEMMCALTRFDALIGFRASTETITLLEELQEPLLEPYVQALRTRPGSGGLREVVTGLLAAPDTVCRKLVRAVVAAAQRALAEDPDGRFATEYAWCVRLSEFYPGDVGVVIALLMNVVRLAPGEAVYLPAGNLHCNLRGVAMEIQANSDNVLRGGLTPKHVDVPELLRVLDFVGAPVQRRLPLELPNGEQVYDAPAQEFRLSRIHLDGHAPFTLDAPGPQILFTAEGQVELTGTGGRMMLPRGAAAYIGASQPPVKVSGEGVLFRATTNVEPILS